MPDALRVRFTAVTSVQKAISSVDATQLRVQMMQEAKKFVEEVREEVKQYPPPVPNYHRTAKSTSVNVDTGGVEVVFHEYERTGNLKRNWQVKSYRTPAGGTGFELFNDARELNGRRRRYAAWVQNKRTQTYFHTAHGWITVQNALELIGGRQGFRDALQRVIDRKFKESGMTTPGFIPAALRRRRG